MPEWMMKVSTVESNFPMLKSEDEGGGRSWLNVGVGLLVWRKDNKYLSTLNILHDNIIILLRDHLPLTGRRVRCGIQMLYMASCSPTGCLPNSGINIYTLI